MQKRSLFIFILIFCNIQNLFSQNEITAFVTSKDYKPLDYFHALLLKPNDSTMLVGGAFIDGKLLLKCNFSENCILKISSIGYEDRTITISPKTKTYLDTIQLKSLELSEVDISAKRPVFDNKNGKIILNVQSTSLADAGNTIDVLNRAPGIQIDANDNISIIGKGSPVIFIDGKEVHSNDELKMLQSNDIVDIKIDRNPSARYSASTTSVIRIKTIKKKSEEINMQVFCNSFIARHFNNSTGIRLNKRTGKFRTFLSYYFDHTNKEKPYTEYENTYFFEDTTRKSSIKDMNLKAETHNVFLGNSYDFNSKNQISFQYNFVKRSFFDFSVFTKQKIKKRKSLQDKTMDADKKEDSYLHNFNITYKSEIDSVRNFIVMADFISKTINGNDNIFEKNLTRNYGYDIFINNENSYEVYNLKSEYNFILWKKFNANIGFKFSQVDNNGDVSQSLNSSLSYRNKNKTRDQISSGFITISKKIDEIYLDLGLRGEYTKRNLSENNENILDSTYFNLFPSASVNYKISDKTDITINYAKKISRPSFSSLNPSISYLDTFSYSQGNPNLKPIIKDQVSLSLNLFNSFSFSLEYQHLKNAIIQTLIKDTQDANINKFTYLNIDKSENLFVYMSYNYSGNKYSAYLSGGIDFPFVDVPYLDEIKKNRQESWNFKFYNDFSISKNISLYCGINYNSKSFDLITEFSSNYNLYSGIVLKFLDRKLSLHIKANDILNTNEWNWHDRYGYIESGQESDRDNSGIMINITYNFNNFRNLFRKNSGSRKEQNRL